MPSKKTHCGDQVVVFHQAAQPAAERGRVVAVRRDARLRVEFADGHQSTIDPDRIAPVDLPPS